MSYNPLKILGFCREIYQNSRNLDLETVSRITVSRTYYSAFLHSREYLKEKHNVQFSGRGEDHLRVERQLKAPPVRQRLLSSMIREMKENRNAADYDLSNPATAISHVTPLYYKHRKIKFDRALQANSIRYAEYITNSLRR